MGAVVIFVVLGVVLISCLVYLRLRQRQYREFVQQNSIALRELYKINKHYYFYPFIAFDQQYTYDNEKFYLTISCQDYLLYQLNNYSFWKKIFQQMGKLYANQQNYEKYLNEISSLIPGKFYLPIGKLNYPKLIRIEQKLLLKSVYRNPPQNFYLTVTLFCSTLKGYIYTKKEQTFSAEEILTLHNRLDNKTGKFYNDRETWDALCRVERGKVSNKMRFAIYARDGHRCQKCGVSEQVAKLEIDHILPIAKGGKSTYDNLQTLCHECNLAKGDKFQKFYQKSK